MPTIASINAELSGVAQRIERAVRIVVTRSSYEITSKLRTGSPAQTGELQQGWRLGRASSSTGVVAAVRITNSVPHAAAIEFGVDPSSPTHSWAASFRKERSKRDKKPQIVLKAGRIWSSSAVGGVSQRVITPATVRDLGRNVADAIIGALSKGA